MSSYNPSYSTLGQYSSKFNGQCNPAQAQVPGELVDVRLIPQYGGVGNEILSHNLGNGCMNDGYFSFCNAYPGCGSGCPKNIRSKCHHTGHLPSQ